MSSLAKSSCGRAKGRRPSLNDWSDSMKSHQSMDFEHKGDNGNNCNALIVEICEDEPNNSNNPVDFVFVTNGVTLKDTLGPYLKSRGISMDKVDCMLENSNTPIPDNSEAIYLVGRKIFVKGKKGNRITVKKASLTGESDIFSGTIEMVKTSLGHSSGAKALYQLQHSNSNKGILSTNRKMSADAISRKSSFVSSKVRDGKRSSSANTFSSSAIHAAAALISAVPETIAMKKCVQKNVPMTPLSVVVAKQLDDEINNSSHRHSLPMTLLAPDMLPKRIPSLRKTSSALQFQLSKTRNLSTSTTPPPSCVIPAATTSAPNQQNHPNSQFFHNSIDSNSSLTGSVSANSTPGNNSIDSSSAAGIVNTSRKISLGINTHPSVTGYSYPPPEDPMSVAQTFQHPYLYSTTNGTGTINGHHQLNLQGPSSFGVTSFQICGCPLINGMPGMHDVNICHYTNMIMPQEETTTKKVRSSTSNRMSLFFGKEKQDMISRLNVLKKECLSRNDLSELELENHWSCIVTNSNDMSEHEKKQQGIIWEVITTEQRYIYLLKQMDELCYYFNEMQKIGFLRDINGRTVFLNFAELFQCNKVFWSKAIVPILKETRDKGTPLSFKPLLDGFDEINEWFKCYIFFNCHAKEAHSYIQKKQSENEFFHEFIVWAESQNSMNRQRLLDIFTAPMQRMTRYALLTKTYLETIGNREEYDYTKSIYDKIDEANSIMDIEIAQNMMRNQLEEIMSCIEGYDVIDNDEFFRLYKRSTRNVLNLNQPMPYLMGPPRFRRVFYKGDIKLRENRNGPKTDVLCFVMTDMFLICRIVNKNKDRLRIFKPPMHITNVVFYPCQDYTGFYIVYTNEFDALSGLYVMQTSSHDETRRWIEFLSLAQEEFRTLRRLNEPSYEMNPIDDMSLQQALQMHQLPDNQGPYPWLSHSRRVSHGMTNPPIEGYIVPDQGYVHRKSNSMDSQVIALNNQNMGGGGNSSRNQHVRSSTTLLNQDKEYPVINGIIRGPRNTTVTIQGNPPPDRSRKKINTSIDIIQPVSMAHSKSSIDMDNLNKTTNEGSGNNINIPKVRSRSNSSGNLKVKEDEKSRSPSPKDIESRKVNKKDDVKVDERCDINEKKKEGNLIKNASLDEKNVLMEGNVNGTITEEDQNGSDVCLLPSSNTNNSSGGIFGRRFERRYHTADQIDMMKPKGTFQTSILKRFSLNLSNAVSGSSKKISNRIYDQNNKKHSQTSTVTSSESFGSSTSGISSASSHDTTGIIIDNHDSSESYRGMKKNNIGNVSISEHSYEKGKLFKGMNDSKVLHIHLEEENINNEDVTPPDAFKSASSTPPPVPQVSPPPISEGDGEGGVFEQEQDIIKYILDNKLETSDV